MDKNSKKSGNDLSLLQRKKWAKAVAIILIVVCFCLLAVAGTIALKCFLLTKNPHFICRVIDFEPTPHFSRKGLQTLLEEMGEDKGCILSRSNLLEVDIAYILTQLERYPVVRSAKVMRVLPGTLKVEIEERMPVAFVCSGRKVDALIDGEGILFPFAGMKYVPGVLPYITNVRNVKRMPFGEKASAPEINAALTFLENVTSHQQVKGAEFATSLIAVNYQLERLECHIKGVPGNNFFAADTVICVPFDAGLIPEALDKFYTILALKAKNGETLSFADLTLKNNINTLK